MSIPDLLVLSRIPNVGVNRLRALVTHFGDPTRALFASAPEIAAVEGFSTRLAAAVAGFRATQEHERARDFARRQLLRLEEAGGSIVSYWDEAYPDLLKRIYDPPAYFHFFGNAGAWTGPSLGVVGTRFPSEYGRATAEHFGREFARLGITVVSGLARGVDTVAHSAALKEGGITIAVIGSGLDVIYPPENKGLSERMRTRGAVISEYEMGAQPDAANFPKRNRLISGLSLGTLIVETDVNGGAMITANVALDQNREVFAVPGNIGAKRSRGCNLLIREGKAKLVESVEDILAELRPALPARFTETHSQPAQSDPGLTLFEQNIYDFLSPAPMHIDDVADRAGCSASDALVNLLGLECKGLIRQLPGKRFVRCRF
jgi:DNA processing protein